ncbi:uncharacterized protein TNCT_235131 [Trichonephila clavata]|uniref:Uncharacterized protein n=1 Tax=Trichonephila clavata TaxID=2740835 RepID=A0A8X6KBE7_TRICU|nr:uncharacterized protein TNCT_235131 [Trichonephila clavata]
MQTMWQPKEKLRRMLVEVQHSLDFDYKLLLTINGLNKSTVEDTAFALLNLDCVADVKNKIEMQIAMEREREVEIQQLYNEEATRILAKRLEQWDFKSLEEKKQYFLDRFKRYEEELESLSTARSSRPSSSNGRNNSALS